MHRYLLRARRAASVLLLLLAAPLAAQPRAYIPNEGDNSVSVIDTASNTVVATLALPGAASPFSVTVSPDGTKVYIGNISSNDLSVINTGDNSVSAALPLPVSYAYHIAVSPDGSRGYVSGLFSNNVVVLDLTTSPVSIVGVVEGLGGPSYAVVSPDGSRVYVAEFYGQRIGVIDAGTLALSSINIAESPFSLALSADGNNLWVGTQNGIIRIADPSGAANVSALLPLGGTFFGLALHPDGGTLFATGEYVDTVYAIDTASMSVTGSLAAGSHPLGVSLTPDGSRLYVANYESDNVSVFDTSSLAPITTIAVGSSPFAWGTFIQPPPPPPEPTAANLRLSISGPATPVRSGVSVPVALRIDNYGPDAAQSPMVVINGSSPPGSISASGPAGWSCEDDSDVPTAARGANSTPQVIAGARLSCAYDGNMPRGTTRLTLNVRAPANPPGGFVSINATVASLSTDAVPANNSASFKLYVKPSSVVAPVPVTPGIR